METRELFERLVTDEPPLTLSVAAISARGRAVVRRRRAVGATGALSAAAVVAVGAVTLTDRPTNVPPTGASPTATPRSSTSAAPPTVLVQPSARASVAGVDRLAFESAAQIAASNARVYGLLVAYAGGVPKVTQGSPLWDTSPITSKAAFVGAQVEYRTTAGIGMLRAVTGTAADAKTRYDGLLDGNLCAETNGGGSPDGSFSLCVVQDLPGGSRIYTYTRREATTGQITNRNASSTSGPALYERDAIVVAADGSVLHLLFQMLTPDASTPVALSDDVTPTAKELGALALDAADSWQPHVGDLPAPAETSIPVVPTVGFSAPSSGAPSLRKPAALVPSMAGKKDFGHAVAVVSTTGAPCLSVDRLQELSGKAAAAWVAKHPDDAAVNDLGVIADVDGPKLVCLPLGSKVRIQLSFNPNQQGIQLHAATLDQLRHTLADISYGDGAPLWLARAFFYRWHYDASGAVDQVTAFWTP